MFSSIRWSIVALAGALLVAAPAGPQAQANPDAEIKKVGDAYAAAWGKGDAVAIAALHSEDALRVNEEGAVSGRAAIEAATSGALAGPFKGTTLAITQSQSKRVTADVYITEGTYRISGGAPPAGTPTSGRYVNTMVRQGGRWLIAASAIVSERPAGN